MKSLIVLLCILQSHFGYAQAVSVPVGWVEMVTLDPIILSWARVEPNKSLEDSSTVMIQKYEYSSEWVEALKKISPNSDKCREVKAKDKKDWNQLYCEKDTFIYAFLWRGEPLETLKGLEKAKEWFQKNE